jgi:gliding motility-associated protein GldM
MDIPNNIHAYRDAVAVIMAEYKQGDKKWTFTPPADISGLSDALKTANPLDTSKIAQFYRSMTLPTKLEVRSAGEVKEMPWPSVMFDHAPIVAAAAMFTALKVDIKNGESIAAEYMLGKIDAPSFNFNKIEPLAFARTGYINQGDSLDLSVMIAAYDSNEVSKIRFGINSDDPGTWTETSGKIGLKGSTPGEYAVKGVIGVKERGETTWKPWEFKYTVGKPTGTVSLPEMNVLYRGYNNVMEGAASGFPGYELTGSNVSLSKSGNGYIAKPGQGREATVTIWGKSEDGSKARLGDFKFRVQALPPAQIYFGKAGNGERGSKVETKLFARYPPEIPLKAEFSVMSWELEFMGRNAKGSGSNLDGKAQSLLRQAKPNSSASFLVKYKGPDGGIRTGGVQVKL